MRKVYVIQDAAGWMSEYFFTSLRKAEDCCKRMMSECSDIYDLPLSIREFFEY